MFVVVVVIEQKFDFEVQIFWNNISIRFCHTVSELERGIDNFYGFIYFGSSRKRNIPGIFKSNLTDGQTQ